MERTTRAVELAAFPQREVRHDAPVSVVVPPRAVTADSGVDFTDTLKFSSPVVQFSDEARDNARILPPGAGGANGAAYKMLRTQVLRRLDQLGASTLGVMKIGRAHV